MVFLRVLLLIGLGALPPMRCCLVPKKLRGTLCWDAIGMMQMGLE